MKREQTDRFMILNDSPKNNWQVNFAQAFEHHEKDCIPAIEITFGRGGFYLTKRNAHKLAQQIIEMTKEYEYIEGNLK